MFDLSGEIEERCTIRGLRLLSKGTSAFGASGPTLRLDSWPSYQPLPAHQHVGSYLRLPLNLATESSPSRKRSLVPQVTYQIPALTLTQPHPLAFQQHLAPPDIPRLFSCLAHTGKFERDPVGVTKAVEYALRGGGEDEVVGTGRVHVGYYGPSLRLH